MRFDLKLDEQITRFANALGSRFAFASHSHPCSIFSTYGHGETQGAGFEFLTSAVAIAARLVGDPAAPPAVLTRLHGFLDEGTHLLADAYLTLAGATAAGRQRSALRPGSIAGPARLGQVNHHLLLAAEVNVLEGDGVSNQDV
jgi:hypothetical protein